jgi:Fe2+ transport system protein FeoA
MKVAPVYLHCALCGLDFEKTDSVCQHGCPLGVACGHVRCPNCAFEFPEPPKSAQWLRRIFGRRSKAGPESFAGATVTLDRVESGTRCELRHLGCRKPGRRNTLTVFGMTPGTEIELLQRHPSFVVRVGETEVGLDEEIAREIYVRRI